MTADNFLIFGIVLIVASIALGLIAYAFVLNRREAEGAEEAGDQAELAPPEPEPPEAPESLAPVPWEQAPTQAGPAAPPEPPPPPLHRAEATPLAVIMRDDASGRLFIRMGDHEFRRPEDVRDEKDRRLIDGLQGALNALAVRRPPAAGRASTEAYAEAPSRPLSMVEQISQIVEKKLEALPESRRAVRLVESGGSVRVYVGVDHYDTIDEVPDADVRRAIREAVSEWEARS